MNTISTVTVSGADAFEFLQGQLTNDLRLLDAQPTLLSAWCNPKGRVICLMTVTKTADGYSLSVPTDLTDDIIKRLTMFRFRAKVEFEVLPGSTPVSMSELIESGIPWIGLEQSEKFTPHMLNLDLLDAISLDKGCYTGQEIVARTHYKGATKRRMFRFESDKPVTVGDKVSADGREIGEILIAADNNLLTIIPVANADENLNVAGIPLNQVAMSYKITPG